MLNTNMLHFYVSDSHLGSKSQKKKKLKWKINVFTNKKRKNFLMYIPQCCLSLQQKSSRQLFLQPRRLSGLLKREDQAALHEVLEINSMTALRTSTASKIRHHNKFSFITTCWLHSSDYVFPDLQLCHLFLLLPVLYSILYCLLYSVLLLNLFIVVLYNYFEHSVFIIHSFYLFQFLTNFHFYLHQSCSGKFTTQKSTHLFYL